MCGLLKDDFNNHLSEQCVSDGLSDRGQCILYDSDGGVEMLLADELVDGGLPEDRVGLEELHRHLEGLIQLVVLLSELFTVLKLYHLPHQGLALCQHYALPEQKSRCFVRLPLTLQPPSVTSQHVVQLLLAQTHAHRYPHQHLTHHLTPTPLRMNRLLQPVLTHYCRSVLLQHVPRLYQNILYLGW